MRHHQSRLRRVRDWLLYVVIAVLIFAVVGAFAVHQAKTGGSPELPPKWLGFLGMTAIVFGYAIRACRRAWRKPKFWLLLTVFFIVHSGLGLFALTKVAVIPLVFYAMLTGIEYVVLTAYLDFFLDSN
jgi:hypothetical protein